MNKIILISYTSLLASNFSLGQATVPFNNGVNTDYLGWGMGVNQNLNFMVYQQNDIDISTGGGDRVGITPSGVGVGFTGPANAGLGIIYDDDNNGGTGLRVQTVPTGAAGNDMIVTGDFLVRANGTNNIGVDAVTSSFEFAQENYGIFSRVCFEQTKAYALVGEVSDVNTPNTWAGWFDGDIWHSAFWPSPSDSNLKTNVTSLSGSLELIYQLTPSIFNYSESSLDHYNFSQGLHYGFISQNIQSHLPHLTKVGKGIPRGDENDEIIFNPGEILLVNYIGVIPIIIDALNERQAIIDQQTIAINSLEEIVEQLEAQLGE